MSTATTTDSADFYALESLLDDDEQDFLHRVRDFMKSEVEPSVNQHWQRGSFPFEIVPGFRQLGLAGLPYQGFGCPGRSFLLDGMVAMELARTDPSIATFAGVHGGLSMGSIYLCGSEEQKQHYLPEMARFDKIGAFGLTEPDVGSGASGGLTTTARKDGDSWILNGQKKWIGNATFGDLTVIWAKDVADGQVKGFIVANDTPGFSTTKLEDKIALRIVQNAVITLDDVRVSEDDRLQNANSFRDTAEVLRMTRAGVAWMAVGCARGAYENALAYAVSREQFGTPDRGLPTGAGPAGADAGQHHVVVGTVRATLAAAGRGPRRGPAFFAGQGVVHGQDARNRRIRTGTAGWKRNSVGAQRRTFRRRRRSHLLLRRHAGDEHADRRARHHRAQCVRVDGGRHRNDRPDRADSADPRTSPSIRASPTMPVM